MARNATIHKALLTISDMDRAYYDSHQLVLAQHPSESVGRMMLRLVAFTLNASPTLQFTRGLSATDEPEIWQKDDTDQIECSILLGEPDIRDLKKACSRSGTVVLYSYGGQASEQWWQQHVNQCTSLTNLSVCRFPADTLQVLAPMAQRSMVLTATIQDGQLWLADQDNTVVVDWEVLQTAS